LAYSTLPCYHKEQLKDHFRLHFEKTQKYFAKMNALSKQSPVSLTTRVPVVSSDSTSIAKVRKSYLPFALNINYYLIMGLNFYLN